MNGSPDATLPPIPHSPTKPVVGNLTDIDAETPILSLMELARQYGPIFQLTFPRGEMVVVSGLDLVNEVCDDQRFDKLITMGLQNVRAFAGDGLFTAWTQEPNWGKAHTILLPTFSQRAMRGYLPQMVDLARQLCDRWGRLNPDEEIDVASDMTRLTLDTIGLCGFNYRFNSFYRDEPHPFVTAMVSALAESQAKARRLPAQDRLLILAHRQFQEDISTMNDLADRLVRERREGAGQAEIDDLLGHMLTGVDKATGESLDDLNIRYQIITFLVAGHETTSGLLSFAIYALLKHPAVLARAYEEVDGALGADLEADPTNEQVARLRYVGQIIKEALRLWPTAPAFTRYPYEDTVLGGQYAVAQRGTVVKLTPILHRDPAVWGDDAEEFAPEHFAPEREQALPPNAYKPFGTGQRACIGRQFAMQEAILA